MKLNTSKSYTLFVGILLFAVGLIGFAFKTSISLPNGYLLLSLLLGFWGVLVAVHERTK